MTKLKKQYSGELNNHVRVKINASNKVGGLKITLPKKFANKLELKAGDSVECYLIGDHIEICKKINPDLVYCSSIREAQEFYEDIEKDDELVG